MTPESTVLRKLYLFPLSNVTLPLPGGRTLEMVSGCYLVETRDGRKILIDSGMNDDAPRPEGAPPARNQKSVLQHLQDLGLAPPDINMVISTHFDVDHAGYHDAFPSAEHIVQRRHYEIARGGHPRFAQARPHWDHPALRYRFVEGDTQLFPGFTLLETSGHAPAHQSVLLDLPRTGPVLLAVDAAILESTFTPERKTSPYDDNEEQLRASTRKLLALAASRKVALVIFGHDGAQWQTLKKSPDYYD